MPAQMIWRIPRSRMARASASTSSSCVGVGEQTCYPLHPIEFERAIFAAECRHQAIAPPQLADGIIRDQLL